MMYAAEMTSYTMTHTYQVSCPSVQEVGNIMGIASA
jgi:hypothetical protein